jgi:hypothetical protein
MIFGGASRLAGSTGEGMDHATPRLSLLPGNGQDPLRGGTCRRSGCSEPVTALGLCGNHLEGYRAAHRRRERSIARCAAANYSTLAAAWSGRHGRARPSAAQCAWWWALAEHLAARGVHVSGDGDEMLLRGALLDALADFLEERAGRCHLSPVARAHDALA